MNINTLLHRFIKMTLGVYDENRSVEFGKVALTLWRKSQQARAFFSVQNIFSVPQNALA
jgi:hypothetical protein